MVLSNTSESNIEGKPDIEGYKKAYEAGVVPWPVGNVYYCSKEKILKYIDGDEPVETKM